MNENPLDQLRPIIQPAYEVSVWPLAMGWWILIGLALVALAGSIFLWPVFKSHRQKKQIQKNTQQLLNALYESCKKESDVSLALQMYLQKSNDIFKRVIHNNPHLANVSHLAGNDWVEFIARLDPSSGFARFYGENLYAARCQNKIHLEELHKWACNWVILGSKKPHKGFLQ